MSDYTRLDAELDATLDALDRQMQVRKASIMGSAVEMDYVIQQTREDLRLKIMNHVRHLADAGLELGNPHCHKDLPQQTKDMVIELAETVEQAIEEFVSDG